MAMLRQLSHWSLCQCSSQICVVRYEQFVAALHKVSPATTLDVCGTERVPTERIVVKAPVSLLMYFQLVEYVGCWQENNIKIPEDSSEQCA